MNFGSDHVYGVDPRIMQAMAEANAGTAPSYCYDDGTKAVEARLIELFEHPVEVFQVLNGTAANSLALSTILPPYGAALCFEGSHVMTDECNAPELFTGGAKFVGLPGHDGKITPAAIAAKLRNFGHDEHGPKPSALTITNATERGTVYRPDELKALGEAARAHGLKVHMDGARFANALVAVGATPAELTWKSGVEVLSFGGSKNGGMFLEAVVFFDTSLAENFRFRRKRAAQLVAKGRFLSAQMLVYLQDDVWLANARRANQLAQELGNGLAALKGVKLSHPVEANAVFASMPRKTFEAVQAAGAEFWEYPVAGTAEKDVHCRFVLSWATPAEDVAGVVDLIARNG
jgi:threonine aldolase